MVHQLTESTKESHTAFMETSESIASVEKSIGDGLAELAFALSGSQLQPKFKSDVFKFSPGYELQNTCSKSFFT